MPKGDREDRFSAVVLYLTMLVVVSAILVGAITGYRP